jgi:hypothetical protein
VRPSVDIDDGERCSVHATRLRGGTPEEQLLAIFRRERTPGALRIRGVDRSLEVLRAGGLSTDVVAWQSIPFGPVLLARAAWMERSDKLERGRRDEQLVAILADKP